jgi:RNAse (barnase) inhibitor barstar
VPFALQTIDLLQKERLSQKRAFFSSFVVFGEKLYFQTMAETHIARIDGNKARTLRAFYPRIAKALAFPEHFGNNLDALFDCLCDLSAIEPVPDKVQLVIDNPQAFLSKEKADRRTATIETLRAACKADNRYDDIAFSIKGI